MFMCCNMHMCADAPSDQKRALDPLGQMLQAAGRCLPWHWEQNAGPLQGKFVWTTGPSQSQIL